MWVATQVLKTTLKTKGRLIAQNIKERMRYMKKILVEKIIVLIPKIGKESE